MTAPTTRPSTNETVRSITRHRSIRRYRPEPIDEATLDAVLASAQASPTSSHKQAYSVIRVADADARRDLAVVADDQEWVEQAPLFLVWCVDLHRIRVALEAIGAPMAHDNVEEFVVGVVDTTLAAAHAFVAAESLGLGGVLIGGLRNDPETVTRLLGLPELVFPLFGMCLGYPSEDPGLKPRLPRGLILHEERYRLDGLGADLDDYDQTVARYYLRRGENDRLTTWTTEMARKFAEAQRPHLRAYLHRQGFRFD
ncbi:MAG TPA: oxygen-insensitive NADPH nitroreductase [Candidatus Limnocylindrales bacterium]|nr:oxygen-insensitive NADPH nitroreductase [Candidatus Limnocylindrales bacterium]